LLESLRCWGDRDHILLSEWLRVATAEIV
jgi:hypothetical protein